MYKDLSDSEMLILNLLWESKRKLSAAEIMEHFQERKWKMTTVSTFLSRMIDKKVIQSERKGRKFLYYPTVTQKELKRRKAWDFVSRNYSSVKDFILALDDEHISEKEAEEIERILSKAEEKI